MLTRHERITVDRATRYIDHVLCDGASPTEQQAAQDFLRRARPSRQRSIPFPYPVCEGKRRDDELAHRGAHDAYCGVVSGSGNGSFLAAPDAGSAAAISGQLVGHEVTEQSGGHDGE